MSDNKRLTPYQVELLLLVQKGNTDGGDGPIDFDQLLDGLSWTPTKAAAHFSIRALIRRNLLQKTPELILRRGRQRVGFVLTPGGRQALDPRLESGPKVIHRDGRPESSTRLEDSLPGVSEVDFSLSEVLEETFRGGPE